MRSLALTLFCLLLSALTAQSSQEACQPDNDLLDGSLSYENGCSWLYAPVAGDTCSSILNRFPNAFSLDDFLAANPTVNAECTNLQIGQQICVAGPLQPAPFTWTFGDGCRKYHHVKAGDDCHQLAHRHGLSLDDFYTFNPHLKAGASLTTGLQYCVGGKHSFHGHEPQPPSPMPPSKSGCKYTCPGKDKDSNKLKHTSMTFKHHLTCSYGAHFCEYDPVSGQLVSRGDKRGCKATADARHCSHAPSPSSASLSASSAMSSSSSSSSAISTLSSASLSSSAAPPTPSVCTDCCAAPGAACDLGNPGACCNFICANSSPNPVCL